MAALRMVAPEPILDYGDLLKSFVALAQVSHEDAHLLYREAGGTRSFSAFRDWVRGTRLPNIKEWDCIAAALNRRLDELEVDREHRLLRGRDSNPQPTGIGSLALKPRFIAAETRLKTCGNLSNRATLTERSSVQQTHD